MAAGVHRCCSDGITLVVATLGFGRRSARARLALLTLSCAIAVLAPAAWTPAAMASCSRDGRQLSPLNCEQLKVRAPFHLDFSRDAGGLADANGVGTGFTMADPPSSGVGYHPEHLTVTPGSPGTLAVDTDKGLMARTTNSQQNALGVGLPGDKVLDLTASLINLPKVTGKYEQAGLWWGNSESDYVKFVIISNPGGAGMQVSLEVSDTVTKEVNTQAFLGGLDSRVTLKLHVDPFAHQATATYQVDGGIVQTVGTVTPPPALFSADAAGIDPTIGTNTFGGIFASHRNATMAKRYVFDDFGVDDVTVSPPPDSTAPTFTRKSIGGSLGMPTALAFGPTGACTSPS